MKFFAPLVAAFVAVVSAQGTGQYNAISIPETGLIITAGTSTVTWTNPSSGTITIKLQEYGGVTTPQDGIVVASNVPASAGTTTITIDPSSVVPGKQYVLETIDDTGAQESNYSNEFVVSGATGTESSTGASSGSSTITGTSSTSGTASATDSSTTGTETGSTRSTSTRSQTSTASPTTSETSAPNNSGNKVTGAQGGLLAFVAAVVAIL